MNLGDELRSVLNQEADMQSTTPPDVDRLIVGGRGRRRQRNLTRAVGAGLAVVLVGGGVYALTQDRSEPGGSRIADQQTATPETNAPSAVPTLPPDPGSSGLRPGTFRILVGSDEVGAPIAADLTFTGPGWDAGNFPLLGDGESFGGVAVYQPSALAAASGCDDDLVDSNLAGTPYSLAKQLATLPGSTVLQPVKGTELLGRYAVHVQVRIPQTCPKPLYYRVAETPRGGRGITWDRRDGTMPPVIMDFWVTELEGKPVVIDTWHQQGASADLVSRISQARDSINFVTSGSRAVHRSTPPSAPAPLGRSGAPSHPRR